MNLIIHSLIIILPSTCDTRLSPSTIATLSLLAADHLAAGRARWHFGFPRPHPAGPPNNSLHDVQYTDDFQCLSIMIMQIRMHCSNIPVFPHSETTSAFPCPTDCPMRKAPPPATRHLRGWVSCSRHAPAVRLGAASQQQLLFRSRYDLNSKASSLHRASTLYIIPCINPLSRLPPFRSSWEDAKAWILNARLTLSW